MEIVSGHRDRVEDIAALFAATFTASEGADEGRTIGALARDLMTTTPEGDIAVFLAVDGGDPVGAIVFTRLAYPEDDRTVFLLSPVAVATDRQGTGIGQRLLRHGLDALAARGVDVALTYGSPDYYGKVGFRPITEEVARAPQPLSLPEGWLGVSLKQRPLDPLKGPSRCAPALDDPAYW